MAELEVHVVEEAHFWRPEPSWWNMVIPLIIMFAAIALAIPLSIFLPISVIASPRSRTVLLPVHAEGRVR